MHIPEGFARVTPYLFVEGAADYMEHLKDALGGEETHRAVRPDGKVANGQIRFGDASVMVSEAGRGFPPSNCTLYFYVDDADAAMARALDHRMTKVMDVMDMDYGDRQGGVKDIAGNIWWISQRLTPEPYR